MPEQQPVIKADNLFKSYSLSAHHDTPVLRGISMQVQSGEFLAIIGASGAGKSTLLHLLGALDDADQGSVVLTTSDGISHNYSNLSDTDLSALRNRYIGFVFQFHHLLPEFTALENVMMPALIAGVSMREAQKEAEELLRRIGLHNRGHHKPSELSGGEQQRTAFARALVNRPALIFADEPTGNLDTANSDMLLDLLRQFREEFHQTFVVVTHSNDIAREADRTLVIKNGIIEQEIKNG
jgi:lipoprotein-releasing system ATP-binding protein